MTGSQMTVPIPKWVVLAIHDNQIEQHGGMPSLRGEGLLDAALAQPFMTFDGQELYPSIVEKAARYGFGIIKNHPFVDGNKRTGAALIIVFLRGNGCTFRPGMEEFLGIIMGVAEGAVSFEALVAWVESQVQRQ